MGIVLSSPMRAWRVAASALPADHLAGPLTAPLNRQTHFANLTRLLSSHPRLMRFFFPHHNKKMSCLQSPAESWLLALVGSRIQNKRRVCTCFYHVY